MTHHAIDRVSVIPLHEQFKRLLLDMIEEGTLKPGATIPPERVLCERYGVSRTTVRAAVLELVRLGVLRREQGRGTFVAQRALPIDVQRLTSFSEDMRAMGRTPSSKLLSFSRASPDMRLAQLFGDCGEVTRIVRLRLADGKPMGIHDTYLPSQLRLEPSDVDAETSLHALLAERYHVQLRSAEETIEASLATPDEAVLLEVAPGSPLLHIERISYDTNGRCCELCTMRYRGDQYRYFVRLFREP